MDQKYFDEIKVREQAAQNGNVGAIQTSQLDIKPLIAEVEKLTEMYGEAEETNEKLICRAEKTESENATLKKEYDEQNNAHHKLFMAYCEQQKQIATLKKALELMATYLVHFGRIDEMLCDDIPQPLHLKYQPKNDGDYENGPCIQCVQEYFQQQAQQTHETQEEKSDMRQTQGEKGDSKDGEK